MNYCPVYEKIGGHAYQAVYPGPIGEVISPQLFGMDKHGDVLSFCSLCNRCSEVCPVEIPLAEFIRKLKRDKLGEGANPPIGSEKLKQNMQEKGAFEKFSYLATNPDKFHLAIKIGAFGLPFAYPFADKLPVIKHWAKYHEVPKLDSSLHKKVKNLQGVIYE